MLGESLELDSIYSSFHVLKSVHQIMISGLWIMFGTIFIEFLGKIACFNPNNFDRAKHYYLNLIKIKLSFPNLFQ